MRFYTPFDEGAVEFLESLNVPAYKIASFENIHHPLLKKIASTRKPVIMSTGMASISELADSVDILRRGGVKDLVLLKCTSTYPATPESTKIATIPQMQQLFDCFVGLSDHTMGMGTSIAAVALGARLIEKHFTLRRADGGVDSAFSLEPDEMRALVIESNRRGNPWERSLRCHGEREKIDSVPPFFICREKHENRRNFHTGKSSNH